jgi:hypothetical protein
VLEGEEYEDARDAADGIEKLAAPIQQHMLIKKYMKSIP